MANKIETSSKNFKPRINLNHNIHIYENLSVQRREQTNSTHMTPDLGIEPGPHWCETSALTTAPSLLVELLLGYNFFYYYVIAH